MFPSPTERERKRKGGRGENKEKNKTRRKQSLPEHIFRIAEQKCCRCTLAGA
ncbi:hypothetical protein WN51_02412 [Melipona quadrifasciata]|uniref:Uncharacterized protein n=1 Tax=Melipona quadrifasciata TaxID=166423 RepID=A0A0N0BEG4_9HYME|nr:hypothetical protein WN51_02412 [Melipona quadrifasciata]